MKKLIALAIKAALAKTGTYQDGDGLALPPSTIKAMKN